MIFKAIFVKFVLLLTSVWMFHDVHYMCSSVWKKNYK